jgi:hypothetical protein
LASSAALTGTTIAAPSKATAERVATNFVFMNMVVSLLKML